MKKKFLICLCLALSFLWNGCANDLTINIPPNYCGHVYIVGDSNTVNSNIVNIDQYGIGYINQELFENEIKFDVIKSNKNITEACNLFSTGLISIRNRDIYYGHFILPCEYEMGESDSYFEQNYTNTILSDTLEQLIINGKVIFE